MTMAVTEPKGRRFHSAKARVEHIFEVPVTTPDYRRCRGFYEDALCMTPTLESSSDDGPMHRARGVGSVEIHGCDGEYIDLDPADLACFDGGVCMATFTATDLDTVFRAVQRCPDATVLSEPQAVSSAPYDGSLAFCFTGTCGERLEICEAMWG